MRIEEPIFLWGLLTLIPLAVFWVYVKRPRKLLWVIAFLFWCLALSRPQLGGHTPTVANAGGDLFLVFDISRSMLVQDIPPSRIRFATLYAQRLFEELSGYRFAIFPFSGISYLQTPLTKDADALVEMMSYLEPDLVTSPSSDLDSALLKLFEAIKRSESPNTQVIVFSDGESETSVETSTLQLYSSHQIPVHTVGVATVSGGHVPHDGRTLGQATMKTHVSHLDANHLQKISAFTRGQYQRAHLSTIPSLRDAIEKRQSTDGSVFEVTREFFPILILLGFIPFLAEFMRRQWPLLIRALLVLAFLEATNVRADELPEDPHRRSYVLFNAAIDREQSGVFPEAAELYSSAIGLSSEGLLKKKAYFNLGNLALEQGDPDLALYYYQQGFDVEIQSTPTESSINQRISKNMVLAARLLEQARSRSGEGDSKSHETPPDSKGPQKDFRTQTFSEDQKRKLFELLVNEERQVIQRIFESRNRKSSMKRTDKPW